LIYGAGRVRDVVIVGSGPAGYTAAIYAARAGLDALVVEGPLPGGALMDAGQIDNYSGFSVPVCGSGLARDACTSSPLRRRVPTGDDLSDFL
jgi:thioredoxin reductase (NADPH)